MPKDLILSSLEIQRFRCFRELRIGHLGRVNLIVGRNDVGKSSILEALRLFARPGSQADLLEVFSARDEVSIAEVEAWDNGHIPDFLAEGLFFGRVASTGEDGAIRIGPLDSFISTLRILFHVSYSRAMLKNQPGGPHANHEGTAGSSSNARSLLFRVGPATRVIPIARMIPGGAAVPHRDGHSQARTEETFSASVSEVTLQHVRPDGLGASGIARLWEEVSLSPREAHVIDALRIVSPGVARVATRGLGGRVGDHSNGRDAAGRVPFVKLDGLDEPIPLRALGDGANRIVGLALALVHAKGGLLLVDEIENGIHYSAQADLWRWIFETAARLRVQVFATTHSYDCIKAFEKAAGESREEGVLIRLARRGDRTLVGEFVEAELETAVEGNIEVR